MDDHEGTDTVLVVMLDYDNVRRACSFVALPRSPVGSIPKAHCTRLALILSKESHLQAESMARGHASPPSPALLPKVSFVKVQDDGSTKPAGVHDGQARSYGCASIDF